MSCLTSRARRPLSIFALALVTTLWSSALLAAPSADPPHLSALVYAAGSRICHQRPERSFHHHGAQYPVCARCLGLYTGAVVGVLGWGLIAGVGSIARPQFRQGWPAVSARRLLVIAGLPTLFTVVTAFIGWWDPGNAIRAALAFPFGAVIAAVVTAVAAGDLK